MDDEKQNPVEEHPESEANPEPRDEFDAQDSAEAQGAHDEDQDAANQLKETGDEAPAADLSDQPASHTLEQPAEPPAELPAGAPASAPAPVRVDEVSAKKWVIVHTYSG